MKKILLLLAISATAFAQGTMPVPGQPGRAIRGGGAAPTSNQVPKYNSATGRYEPADDSTGGAGSVYVAGSSVSNPNFDTTQFTTYAITNIVVKSGAIITNLVGITPTFASFINSQHTHLNAAGGGTLDAAALGSGTIAAARMPAITGDVTTSAGAVASTLATVNGNVGSFGDATHVPAVTVNAKGLVTGVSSVAISGVADNWAASGTTNSTLPGNAAVYSLTVTNGITSGNTNGWITVGGDGATLAGASITWTNNATNIMRIFYTNNLVNGGIFYLERQGSTTNYVLRPAVANTDYAALADPIFTSSLQLPNGAAPTTDAFGEIAGDNNAWASGRGAIQFYDGTANTYVVGVLASDTPSNGQVPTWNTGGTVTWETPSAGGAATTYSSHASTGNGTTVETTIFTQSVSGSTLSADGDVLRGVASITCAANANTKTLKLYLGSTVLGTITHSYNNTEVTFFFWIMRGSAGNSQHFKIHAVGEATSNFDGVSGTASEDLSTALTLKITATATANNDVVGKFWKVVKE